MSRRLDVFVRADRGSDWSLHAQSVLPSLAHGMVPGLESDGRTVLLTTAGKTLGRFVYQTPDTQKGGSK